MNRLFAAHAPSASGKVPVVFRSSVPEIPSTTYGTFAIYRYPAKFIPQVVAYVLKEYAEPGMRVFDPFAGYGTVGTVSRVYGCGYELWDLNPVMEVIHRAATLKPLKLNATDLVNEVRSSEEEFIPDWSNLDYWFPEEFIPLLARAWGFVHALDESEDVRYLLLVPLIKVTKYFSYGDEKVHKLYRSKYALRKVENLLKGDWETHFYAMLEKEVRSLLRKLEEYSGLHPKDVPYRIRSGVDVLETELEEEVNILITSPPYLQAQEYIRSTKMELFWLGYSEDCIRSLTRKEIPYRPVEKVGIYSESYHRFRERIEEKHLLKLYDRYFHAVLGVLSSIAEKVTDYMCIFVGPAKVRTLSVPIDDIVAEHMRELGWEHTVTLVDRIVSRVMFESAVNPASGKRDSRIKTEHLVVLKRR